MAINERTSDLMNKGLRLGINHIIDYREMRENFRLDE